MVIFFPKSIHYCIFYALKPKSRSLSRGPNCKCSMDNCRCLLHIDSPHLKIILEASGANQCAMRKLLLIFCMHIVSPQEHLGQINVQKAA